MFSATNGGLPAGWIGPHRRPSLIGDSTSVGCADSDDYIGRGGAIKRDRA